MRKLILALLLFLASSPASADDVCISAISNSSNRPLDRDFKRIVAPPPVYPSHLLAEGTEGFVDIRFEVTVAGTVRDLVVVDSVPPGLFDEAALQGVLKFYYKPRIVDGEPVAVEGVRTRFKFSSGVQDRPDDQKPAKQKKKPAQAVSKHVYDQIVRAQSMVDAEVYTGALGILESLNRSEKLTEYEQANVLNYIGFVHYNMENIVAAIAAYEEMLRIPSLEAQIRKQTTFTLAQLNTLQEQYANAIRLLDKWFTLEPNPAAAPYILYAQNLYQTKRYPEMVKPIETGMLIAGKRDEPMKEDWYTLLNFAYFQMKDHAKVRDIQRILHANWPKDRYGYALAAAYMNLGELQVALDTMKEVSERWPSDRNSDGLAKNYEKLGDKRKTLAVYHDLLSSWPETDYLTPLHLAAAEGDIALVAELMASGSGADMHSGNQSTPLQCAIRFEQEDTTKMLISAGADVNAVNETGLPVLHFAIAIGNASIIELLIEAGARVNARSKNGTAPLHSAVNFGNVSLVERLIAAGADVNAKHDTGSTPLHTAAKAGNASVVESLIAAGADVNARSENGYTPLWMAEDSGDATVVESLISAGADVNAKSEIGMSVLHMAAGQGKASIVELLIAAGAHVNAKAEIGVTPLHAAAQAGDLSVIEMLIAAGADVNAKGNRDITGLHLAAQDDEAAIVELLIGAGADVHARAEMAMTPLHEAANAGNASAVELLIAAGAGVDPGNEWNWTPVSYAASDGHIALAEQLIDQGARVAGVEIVADSGYANAQYFLGSLYERGRGVRRKNSKAVEWYRAAAEQDNADAAYALGEMYLEGRGIRTNKKQAAHWVQAAAYRGHRRAQMKLSELYRNGVGVKKNTTEASMWSCFAGAFGGA